MAERVSDLELSRSSISNFMDRQERLIKLQTSIATGKRIQTAGDDPVAASRVVNLTREVARLEQLQKNGEAANNILEFEDTVFSEVRVVLQRVRELSVQVANVGAANSGDRQIIASELQQLLAQLTDLANTQDSNGNYIFSGYKNNTQPITTATSGHYQYNGDQGQRNIQVGASTSVPVNSAADQTFFDISAASGSVLTAATSSNTGTVAISPGQISNSTTWATAVAASETFTITFNDPATTFDVSSSVDGAMAAFDDTAFTSGMSIEIEGVSVTLNGTPTAGDSFTIGQASKQDIFTTIDRLVDSLQNVGDIQSIQYNAELALQNVENAEKKVGTAQARTGTRLGIVTANQSVLESLLLRNIESKANIEETNIFEAISELTNEQDALDASMRTFVSTQEISLFNYIR